MEDVQAIGEAFSPQKRTSSTSKREISFFYFCGSFLPSWIRIQPTKIITDPIQGLKVPATYLYLRQLMIFFSEARRPEMEAAVNQTLRLYDGDHREYLKSSLYECALQGISTDARYTECM